MIDWRFWRICHLLLVIRHLVLEGIRLEAFFISRCLPRTATGQGRLPGTDQNWQRLHFFSHLFAPLRLERNPRLELLPDYLLLHRHPEHPVAVAEHPAAHCDGGQGVLLGNWWLRKGLVTSKLQGDG